MLAEKPTFYLLWSYCKSKRKEFCGVENILKDIYQCFQVQVIRGTVFLFLLLLDSQKNYMLICHPRNNKDNS